MKYRIEADGEVVWRGDARPSDSMVDQIAWNATNDGWNGTVLELFIDDAFVTYLYPEV